MKRTDYLYIHRALGNFFGDMIVWKEASEYGALGVFESSVAELKSLLQYEPLNTKPELLKNELLSAFSEQIEFWWWLNSSSEVDIYQQSEHDMGLQRLSMECWWEHYPKFTDYDLYHPEMLKLLCKKYIWDIAFPSDFLPNYQPPESSELPR